MTEQGPVVSCPECGRRQTESRNFCPFCGHRFQASQPQTLMAPAEPGGVGPPASSTAPPLPTPPPPIAPQPRPRRFRLADLRVLFGVFGVIDLPVIAVLIFLLVGSGLGSGSPDACGQLDRATFSPSKYTAGWTGELQEDTLFAADTSYIIKETLIVPADTRLLVEEGAQLLFEPDTALEVHGSLYVCGSAKRPVTMTSEEGEAGAWHGIRFFKSEVESVVSHALIQFAGDRAVYIENSAPRLQDVKISSSRTFPISSDGIRVPTLGGEIDLEDNPFNGIEIRSGTITGDSIEWPDQGVVYIVSGPIEIDSNTTLAISPGVVVKFWYPPNGKNPGIRVQGLLKADEVHFTSVYDSREEMGGVSYIEAHNPEPGDWAGITFWESSTKCYLRNSTVSYAGRDQGSVTMVASSPELSGLAISDGAWYPLSSDADSFPVLSNISLMDNSPGDALEIRGDSSVSGSEEHRWSILGDGEQIVRVLRGTIKVEPEAVLVIEPGVVVKFEEGSRLVVAGTLSAVGKGDDGQIVFTSLRDDDFGGNTDNATSPQDERKWDGILFDKVDDTSILENCIVRYASVGVNGGTPRLIDNLIKDSRWAAIWVTPDAAPELRAILLDGNDINGVAVAKGTVEGDVVWPLLGSEEEQLVRVLTDEVTIAQGATLVIEAGAVIKAEDDGLLRINGGLQVAGRENYPVIFTSLQDDSAGGDTNQKLAGAHVGDWPGLEVGEWADARFENTIVRFARRGLVLRGRNIPAIAGWLRVQDGDYALWCEGEAELQMPGGFEVDRNEHNNTQCPPE